jgi:hypothetical protein
MRFGHTWSTGTWIDDPHEPGITRPRWRQADHRVAPYFIHPDAVRRDADSVLWDVHWPFMRTLGEYADGFETYCSCFGCSSHAMDDTPRARARLAWQRDWQEEMEAEDARPGLRVLRERHWTGERGSW